MSHTQPTPRRASPAAPDSYHGLAAGYDASARFTAGIRARTIVRLAVRPGDTVLDVGSGTGLSLPLLVAAVGPQGRVVGVERSSGMMALARERARAAGWQNVELIEAEMERAALPDGIDAILFHYVHDVLQSAAALERLFAHARAGARVAVAGVKYHPWWLAPLNVHVWLTMRRYSSNPVNLGRPWQQLERYVPCLQRESTLLGRGYIGWGVYRPPAGGAGR
jgi:arsenite methyltransferase